MCATTIVKIEESKRQSVPPLNDNVSTAVSRLNADSGNDEEEELEPDEDNYSFYCRVCEYSFSETHSYHRHLQTIHKLSTDSLLLTIHNPLNIPDIHDPNFNCSRCEKRFGSKAAYYKHLQLIHKMNTNTTTLRQAIPNEHDPDFYCCGCGITFDTRLLFRQHLKQVHKMTLAPLFKQVPNPHILPDKDNIDHYCITCDRNYGERHRYCKHLELVHEIELPPILPGVAKHHTIINPELLPDTHDPNNYCRSCEILYYSRITYLAHLNIIHKMTVDRSIKRIPNPHITPDPDDPNFRCHACEKTYSERRYYNSHLSTIHNMVIVNPNAIRNPRI